MSRRALHSAVALTLGVVCVFQTGRLAAFMVNPARYDDSIQPASIFFLRHSCLTSHFQAARLQRAKVPNLYEPSLYQGAGGEPAIVDGFSCDLYLYPPTALLLPRIALEMSSSFRVWRTTWFFLELLILALVVGTLSLWFVGSERIAALVTCLIVFAAPSTMLALQIGNLHLVVIAAAVAAMIAFHRNAHAFGGALLAWAVVTKLFPGILVLVLLIQRRWRAAAWTSIWTLIFIAVSIAVLGFAPFKAFIGYQLPRLSSGESWTQVFAYPETALINDGIPGLAQKFVLLGLPDLSRVLHAVLPTVFLVVLLAAVFLRSSVTAGRREVILGSLALLQLASLQAPFVPDVYAHFVWTWILALMLSTNPTWSWRTALATIALVSAASQDAYFQITSERLRAIVAMLHQVAFLAFTLYLINRSADLKAEIPAPISA